MAQLVERSLLTRKVCGSNPVIGKLLDTTFVYCIEKMKMRLGMAQFVYKKVIEPISGSNAAKLLSGLSLATSTLLPDVFKK